MKTLISSLCLIAFLGTSFCNGRDNANSDYPIYESNIRFGYNYYSIILYENGKGYVIKGKSSFYTESFAKVDSIKSPSFQLDPQDFFKRLDTLYNSPLIEPPRIGIPRVEIHYKGKVIYDASRWDEHHWDLFRPLLLILPDSFSPFSAIDYPFEF